MEPYSTGHWTPPSLPPPSLSCIPPPPAPAPERQQEGEAGLFNWRDSVWQEVRSVPGPERWQLLPSFWDQVSLGFS